MGSNQNIEANKKQDAAGQVAPKTGAEAPTSSPKEELSQHAQAIIEERFKEVNNITEIDQNLQAIKSELGTNKITEQVAEHMTVGQAIDGLFTTHGNQTLATLPSDTDTEIGLLATDLGLAQCMISVLDKMITDILTQNPEITQKELETKIAGTWSQMPDITGLQKLITQHQIQLSSDEQVAWQRLTSQTPLAQDLLQAHGTTPSHYSQTLAVVQESLQKKVNEHYSVLAKVSNRSSDKLEQTSHKLNQGVDRVTHNPGKAVGGAVVGGLAVYGICRFVKWLNSDDETELTPEQKTVKEAKKSQYNGFISSGKTLYHQGKKAEALGQFNEALKTGYNDKEASKWIKKCTGGGVWSSLGTFLKRAAGIGVVGGAAYTLYKYRNWDSADTKTDADDAMGNIENQIKKFEALTPEEQTHYNNIGTSINQTYHAIHTFPAGDCNNPPSNDHPLDPTNELILGTDTDKCPGTIPYIFSGYDNIGQILNSDQILKLIVHANINQLEDIIKQFVANGMDHILGYIAQASGFDRVTLGKDKFVDWIKEGNNSQTIQIVCRKLIKGISWLQLVHRHQVGIKLKGELAQANCTIVRQGVTTSIPTSEAEQIKLINTMCNNPSDYSINGKDIATYLAEFEHQSIKDLDIQQITKIDHADLMQYNVGVQEAINNVNQDRNIIHQMLTKEGEAKTLDYLIDNAGKDISNSMIDGIGLYASQKGSEIYEYLPFAGAVEGIKAIFDSGKEAIVNQLMEDAGYQELINEQKKILSGLKGKSPAEIQAGIDTYFATLKELQAGTHILISANKDETTGNCTISLANMAQATYDMTAKQIGGGLSMIFDPDAGAWTKAKGGIKVRAGASIPAMLWGPTRKPYLKSIEYAGKGLRRGGHKLFQGISGALNNIRSPRVPASVTNQQINATAWFNRLCNRLGAIPKGASNPLNPQEIQQVRAYMKIPGMHILNGPIAQGLLKAVGVAGGTLEAIHTRQSWRASEAEIKAMEAENKQLAQIMESQQRTNLIAGGVGAATAIASALAGGPAGLVLLGAYLGIQGFKYGSEAYYDVLKSYHLNTANYLKHNTGFIKASIVSAQSRNANIDIGFKDYFQSFVSMLPLGTEDFHGLRKSNQAQWTAEQAMVALLTIDEMTRNPQSSSDMTGYKANIGIRLQYIKTHYPKLLTADQLKGDPFADIDEMIIQSHIACKAKDPTFNCDPTLEAVQSKYQELMNGFCDGGVANLDNLYQTQPGELYKMYALCQSQHFQTLYESKTNLQTRKTLESNRNYLITYWNYKKLDQSIESLPDIQLTDTENLQVLENFLLYDFSDLSPIKYSKTEAISMFQKGQYKSYSTAINSTSYGVSGHPGQDLLYQYARYLGYGISTSSDQGDGTNNLDALKKFFAYQENKDPATGTKNQDKKGIYWYEAGQYRGIQKNGGFDLTHIKDEDLKDWTIIDRIGAYVQYDLGDQSGAVHQHNNPMINTASGSGESIINRVYVNKIQDIAKQIKTKYAQKDQVKKEIASYISTYVKNDGSEYIELPQDLIQKAMEAGIGNVQAYLYGIQNGKLHGLVAQSYFENIMNDSTNSKNELLGTHYEVVDNSAHTTPHQAQPTNPASQDSSTFAIS